MDRGSEAIKLEFEGYTLELKKRILRDPEGKAHNLTPRLFDTLLCLASNTGQIVLKDELIEAVWGDLFVEENNLSQNISQLRKLFGERAGERRFIETVTGKGFRFLPDVRSTPEPAGDAPEAGNEAATTSGGGTASAATSNFYRSWPIVAIGAVAVLAAAGYFFFGSTFRVSTPRKKVAVLPFQALVPGSENPALELGITDTLIWKLSRGDLEVTPFSSVRRFAGTGQDPAAAGRELGVEAVLEGSINVVGDRVRISVRLTRSDDGALLWSNQFDEDFKDVFAVQDSIASRVADELKASLGVNPRKNYTENAEAYKLFLQGRYLSQRARPDDIRKSIVFFENALAIDPDYAPAYVGIADARRALVLLSEEPPVETLSLAKAAADRAVAIDDGYAEGHAVRGWLAFWYDWDWEKAKSEAKRAIQLDPRSSDAHQFYAHLLSNTGRHDEALAETKTALDLEPLSLRANSFQGMFLFNAGRYSEAAAQFQRVLDLDPQYRLALMFGARARLEMGEYETALDLVRGIADSPASASDPFAVEASILAASGQPVPARKLLTRLESESLQRYISPYNMALVHQRLGESEKALDLLERAYETKDIRMVFLGVEPTWKPLRGDPRFDALLRKMNLKAA